MDEQEIYRLVKAKEPAIKENLLMSQELRSLKEAIIEFLDKRLANESLLSLRYRRLKAELQHQTLWARESGYSADGPAFIEPWIDILEQYLGDKAVKRRLEDESLRVESRIQGEDEHLFVGFKKSSGEKVHVIVDGKTGEIRIDPEDQAPHELLQRVEVTLTTRDGRRVRSTRGALEFLEKQMGSGVSVPSDAPLPEHSLRAPSPLSELRVKYGRFLSRLRVEWESEKGSDPSGVDEGKAIMVRARQALLDLRTDLSAFSGTQGAMQVLDQALADMTSIQRHELFIDGGRSFRAFWARGDEILAMLEQARRVLGPSYVP